MSRISAPVRFRLTLAVTLFVADGLLLERTSGCAGRVFDVVCVFALFGVLLDRPLGDWRQRRLEQRRSGRRSEAPPAPEGVGRQVVPWWFVPAVAALLAVVGVLMWVLVRAEGCAVAYPVGGAIVVAALGLVALGDRHLGVAVGRTGAAGDTVGGERRVDVP